MSPQKAAVMLRLVIFATAFAVTASAQDQTATDQAQVRFQQAVELMKSDHCGDAIPLLQESQRQDPASGTLANLASCYVRLGRTGSAYLTYKKAARAAILEKKLDLQKSADDAAAILLPKLTQLRVVPLGSGEMPEIRINGQPVEDVRSPIPLDQGENIIEATAPGREPWRRILSAPGQGALMVIEVPDLRSAPELHSQNSRETMTRTPRPFNDTNKRLELRPYALVAAGVGVVGLAVGTVLAFDARSKQDDSNRYCDGKYCTQPGFDLREKAQDRAEFATWSVAVGLVSLGTAATLWFLSDRKSSETPGINVINVAAWTPSKQSVGVTLEGRL